MSGGNARIDSADRNADAGTPTPQRARGGSIRRIRAVARRHWYVLLRSPHRAFDLFFWPVVDTVLFGSLGVYFAHGSTAGLAYLLTGIVLWHVVYQSEIGVATGFLEETWSRSVLSFLVTPLHEAEYIAGVALFGLLKVVAGVGVVTLAAAGLYAFHITVLGWWFLPVAALLLLSGWVIALLVIGLVLRFGNGAEVLAWGITFLIMPLSGVFYPVRALPVAFRPVAAALPTTHAFAAGRAVLTGGDPVPQLLLAAGTTALSALLALAFVAAMLRTFRRRGFVTRYS